MPNITPDQLLFTTEEAMATEHVQQIIIQHTELGPGVILFLNRIEGFDYSDMNSLRQETDSAMNTVINQNYGARPKRLYVVADMQAQRVEIAKTGVAPDANIRQVGLADSDLSDIKEIHRFMLVQLSTYYAMRALLVTLNMLSKPNNKVSAARNLDEVLKKVK